MRKPLLLALLPLSLAAQDRFSLALEAASQAGRSHHSSYRFIDEDTEIVASGEVRSKRRTQVGLTGTWKALAFGRLDLALTAGWRASAKADVWSRGQSAITSPLGNMTERFDERVATLDQRSLSLGAEATFRLPVEVGGGLQVRRERLDMVSQDREASATTTTTRPWVTLHAGWTWQASGLRPFTRLMAALPLTRSDFPTFGETETGSEGKDVARFLAPRGEVTLQAGLRF